MSESRPPGGAPPGRPPARDGPPRPLDRAQLSGIPLAKVFDVSDVEGAERAAEEMVRMGFAGRKDGFKVLMPKEKMLAKRIGFTVVTGIRHGLRRSGRDSDVGHWTYHEDAGHYAILLAGADALEGCGLARRAG